LPDSECVMGHAGIIASPRAPMSARCRTDSAYKLRRPLTRGIGVVLPGSFGGGLLVESFLVALWALA
jgi:hypothetical protein